MKNKLSARQLRLRANKKKIDSELKKKQIQKMFEAVKPNKKKVFLAVQYYRLQALFINLKLKLSKWLEK
jgi:hypothetical protein